MRLRQRFVALAVSLCAVAFSAPDLNARVANSSLETATKLAKGEVVVEMHEQGGIKYVSGKILIKEPAARVWPILTNPFEYQGKICPHMKNLRVMTDTQQMSRLHVDVDCGVLMPLLSYVVESHYIPDSRIDFRRIDGNIKDFRGYWLLEPMADQKQCQVTYSMYIEPGFPVPQWIVREGVKMELPRTLLGLRKRVNAICESNAVPEARSIQASRQTCLVTKEHESTN